MNERSIFMEALARETPAQRSAYLEKACGGDAAMRHRVEALLASHEQAGSFLGKPVPERLAQKRAMPVPPEETRAQPSVDGDGPGPFSPAPGGEGLGSRIGPYKLLQQIGEGGMGTVYMAEQEIPVQRKVALKIIKPGMDSRQIIARFEAERQALALMDHPNIARVLDAGTTQTGRPYFVMELVKGVPITKYCDERRLTPKQRLELFVPVCQAVQHAHQKGIIHRDLKPSNVMVCSYDGKPVPKVIDFGVAKATGQKLTERTMFTEIGQVVGTLEYMSPEQAELNQLDIDTRSDVYSLGVLLYELLTGSTPLERKRLKTAAILEVLRLIREEEPPRPSTRLSTTEELPVVAANRGLEQKKLSGLVRGELDWIAMKALEKDRNRRYETANEFAQDIERYLADEPVLACPPSGLYRLRKFARRHKGQVTAVAAMLSLLLAGTGVSTWQAVRATHAEQETGKALAAETAAKAQTREALDALTDDVVETMFTRQQELGETEKGFLRKVLGFYETFAQQSVTTAEARFLRAKGYYTVAHLRAVLGEHHEAAAGFQQAEALLEVLADEFPDASEYRYKLARTEGNRGIELAKVGQEAAAETAFRRGIALRTRLVDDFPNDPKYRLELANNCNDLGFLFELQRKYPEAEQAYRQALDLKEKLAAEAGAAPLYHLELARSLSTMGQLLRKREKNAESEKMYRQALQIQQEQLEKGPATARDRQTLANSWTGLGIALAELKKEDEAEKALRQALEIRRKLTDDFPRALAFRYELANAVNDLGYLLTRQGKDAQAEEPYRQALELRKQIVAQAGPVPRYRQELAEGHHNLAHVLRVTHRTEAAESAWREALEVWKQLAEDLPQVPDFQDGLAGTLTNLARLANQRREFDAAVALLEKAGPHLQAALKAKPQDPGVRQSYRDYLAALAQGRLGLADHARLATTADDLARFGYDPANDTCDAACLLGRCVTLANKDAQLAQSYAERALALLRQAVAQGYRDAARLKKDPALEPLRTREEFRMLLAELEGKIKE
jgi:eukaryotic-like serine/threonine-protein kinase